MIKYNPYLFKIEQENSFATLNKKVNEYKLNNPTKKIISLGIGDVSRPIPRPIIEEMHKAVEELSDINTFKGYGYYYGHDFLRQAILDNEYGVFNFTKDEIRLIETTIEKFKKNSLWFKRYMHGQQAADKYLDKRIPIH